MTPVIAHTEFVLAANNIIQGKHEGYPLYQEVKALSSFFKLYQRVRKYEL